ncbi:MAG TPA: hypothetical protein VFV95_18705 [Vicinamibacterales bacterium]|nr:hypothetical protein [Vicinamibacterales bacterium]
MNPSTPITRHRVSTTVVLTVAAVAGATLIAQDRPLPDFDTFTAQVKKHLQTDEDLQAGYAFTERETEQKLDGSGRVKEQNVKVYEVYPGLPGEDRYRRLIEENGKPVPPAELEKKDRERQKKAEQYAREQTTLSESDRQRQKRDYEKAMKERREAIDDIFNVFDVRMVGRESIDGHDAIAFTLTPRPKATASTDSGRMMRHFSARAWISESDYALVKVNVEAVEPVSFGLGLLARLQKGATASYQRRKVNGESWLPARVTYRGSGRVLLVKSMHLGGTSEFSNYRKFSVDTTTEIAGRE